MVAKIATTHINSISRKNPKIIVKKKCLYLTKELVSYLDPRHLRFHHPQNITTTHTNKQQNNKANPQTCAPQ
jgi:hypothetical protein